MASWAAAHRFAATVAVPAVAAVGSAAADAPGIALALAAFRLAAHYADSHAIVAYIHASPARAADRRRSSASRQSIPTYSVLWT